jgi:hypothetical protein
LMSVNSRTGLFFMNFGVAWINCEHNGCSQPRKTRPLAPEP